MSLLRKQRHKRVRAKVKGTKDRPRLSVFRSLRHTYAYLIDDTKGNTLMTASDIELLKGRQKSKKTTKTELARKVGERIAEKASAKKITHVVFDRGGYKYHGRVKALAEGVRKGGLIF